MAEREGFEPSLGFTLNTLSRRAPSATQPPLRIAFLKPRHTIELRGFLQANLSKPPVNW